MGYFKDVLVYSISKSVIKYCKFNNFYTYRLKSSDYILVNFFKDLVVGILTVFLLFFFQTVDLQNKLNEIFGRVPAAVDISSRPNSPHPNSRDEHRQTPLAPPVYNIKFPSNFIYWKIFFWKLIVQHVFFTFVFYLNEKQCF